jgi:hypothetical protein
VLAIVVWCASRMWPVPESRLQAQQRLEARLPASGRNGYPLLWTLAFDDLDARQREQALAEDVRRWEADRAATAARPHLAADHASCARGRRPAAGRPPVTAWPRCAPTRSASSMPTPATSSCMRAWTSWPMRTTSCRRSGPRATASWCRCRPMAW